MKLKYSIHNKNEQKSFYVKRKNTPYRGDDWHYHDEFELYFPMTGSGIRIVGDSMEYYGSNELVFVGLTFRTYLKLILKIMIMTELLLNLVNHLSGKLLTMFQSL